MSESRCVIVTGGSRGLGLDLVTRLLEDGYAVATCSRQRGDDLQGTVERAGTKRALWHPCQVGIEQEEEEFFGVVQEWVGDRPLHALVNNAGIAVDGVLATLPVVEIERIMATNLLGAMRLARHFVRALLASRGSGRIVNVTSIIGSRGYTGLTAYSASKAGLDGFTRSLAREVGRRGITVNSVAPGYLDTDMSAGLQDRQRQQIVNRTPLGRLGRVGDVTPLIRFLLSDEAGFITGQTIFVDGGVSG